MRFEVGDKVLVRNDLEVGRLYDGVGFAVSMANYLGKVLTIKEVKKNSRYSVEESPKWSWTDKMFVAPEDMTEAQRALIDTRVLIDASEKSVKEKETIQNPDAPRNDPVSHPSHYTDGRIEVIDFIQDKGLDFCRGNIVMYVARAGKKGSKEKELEDLKKARQYCDFAIRQLEGRDGR